MQNAWKWALGATILGLGGCHLIVFAGDPPAGSEASGGSGTSGTSSGMGGRGAGVVSSGSSGTAGAGGAGGASGAGGSAGGHVFDAKSFGNDGDQKLVGMVRGKKDMNALVLTGTTTGTGPFDPCAEMGTNSKDIFVSWYDSTALGCNKSKRFGGSEDDNSTGIAADPNGGVAIVGHSLGNIDFGQGLLVNAGGNDVIAANIGQDACQWQKSFGDMEAQEGLAIAMDSTGATWIGGKFKGKLQLGMTELDNPFPSYNGFLAKLDKSGNPAWAKHIGDAHQVNALAVNGGNDVIVLGQFAKTLNLGQNCAQIPENAGVTNRLFLVKLDSAGGCQWSKLIGEGMGGVATNLSVQATASNGIVMTGGFARMKLFANSDCATENTSGSEDIFVAQLDDMGQCTWSRHFTQDNTLTEIENAGAIATVSAGDLYVTGDFRFNIRFDDNHVLKGNSNRQVFVVKLDSAGNPLWSLAFESTGNVDGSRLVPPTMNDPFLLVGGNFVGTMSLDNLPPLTSVNGSTDIFLAKLNP
jgi:hypothetical protein